MTTRVADRIQRDRQLCASIPVIEPDWTSTCKQPVCLLSLESAKCGSRTLPGKRFARDLQARLSISPIHVDTVAIQRVME